VRLLDKYTAIAQLLGDVLGLPLMPWTLGEPVGKAAAKLPAVMTSEAKKARKAAKRKGQSAEGQWPWQLQPHSRVASAAAICCS
jgi:hypothetical protein